MVEGVRLSRPLRALRQARALRLRGQGTFRFAPPALGRTLLLMQVGYSAQSVRSPRSLRKALWPTVGLVAVLVAPSQ